MNTEINVFMNVLDIVMDIKGKTKDTNKARLDVAEICDRKIRVERHWSRQTYQIKGCICIHQISKSLYL